MEPALKISIVSLGVAAFSLGVNYFVNVYRTHSANKVRYWMFAHEAVELHKRWVLYAGQVLGERPGLSRSQPFEWITYATVEEFLRVGGEESVINAVYRVKQLQFQMMLQIKQAQEAGEAVRAVNHGVPAFEDRSPEDHKAALVAWNVYIENLRYIPAFLFSKVEWPEVCPVIDHLIDRAEHHGHDVKALRERFEDQKSEGQRGCDKYQDMIESRRAAGSGSGQATG